MSSPEEPVLYTADSTSGIARITINRADRRNAISPEVVEGITAGLDSAAKDDGVRAAVLTGAGDKAFCAGGDLGGATQDGPVGQHFDRAMVGDLFTRMRTSRLPVIARVNGHALGGGFGLMLACDLVIAADHAEFGMPEVNIGLWPFMVTAVVQRDIPRKVALDLMFSGRRVPTSEGLRWGFVNRVVPSAQLDDAVAEIAGTVAAKSALVVGLGKRSFYRAEDRDFDDAIDYLAGMLTVCLQSEDTAEGISAFYEKRDPHWKGR